MKLIINVDKVEKIYINKPKQSSVKLVKSKPEIYTFFGLIKIASETKQYWYYPFSGNFTTREEVISEDSYRLYINKETLYESSIWEKANIYIVMSRTENIRMYYDTIDELNKTIDNIIASSKNNLVIIED